MQKFQSYFFQCADKIFLSARKTPAERETFKYFPHCSFLSSFTLRVCYEQDRTTLSIPKKFTEKLILVCNNFEIHVFHIYPFDEFGEKNDPLFSSITYKMGIITDNVFHSYYEAQKRWSMKEWSMVFICFLIKFELTAITQGMDATLAQSEIFIS